MEIALENTRKRFLFALEILKINWIEIIKLSASCITRLVYVYRISEGPKKTTIRSFLGWFYCSLLLNHHIPREDGKRKIFFAIEKEFKTYRVQKYIGKI